MVPEPDLIALYPVPADLGALYSMQADPVASDLGALYPVPADVGALYPVPADPVALDMVAVGLEYLLPAVLEFVQTVAS